jgi:hypothetical protein
VARERKPQSTIEKEHIVDMQWASPTVTNNMSSSETKAQTRKKGSNNKTRWTGFFYIFYYLISKQKMF